MSRAWIVVASIASFGSVACSAKEEPPPAASSVPRDAGPPIDGITAIGHFDPNSGMHLDEAGPPGTPRPHPSRPPGKPVDITLRSSPPGAMVAVDTVQIGRTPIYAPVTSGVLHDFTFVLEGYALARYRFVPIQSGVVHATMEAVSSDVDAGVALPPEMLRPAPPAPIPPPPTLVSPPPDAAISIDATAATTGVGPAPF